MRSRWIASALVVVALASGAAGVSYAVRPQRQEIDWTLLGTEQQGRVLVIGFADNYATCSSPPEAAVRSRTSASVELSVTANVGRCRTEGSAIFRPVRVALDRPLDGQTVRGAGRSLRKISPVGVAVWAPSDPQVVGLVPGDAQGVAVAFNLRMREVGPMHSRGFLPVTAQRRFGDVIEIETRASRP